MGLLPFRLGKVGVVVVEFGFATHCRGNSRRAVTGHYLTYQLRAMNVHLLLD